MNRNKVCHPTSFPLFSLLISSADVLSAENIFTEIKKAQEREEIQRAEEEIRQRKFSTTSGNVGGNSEYLHVKSLKNIASNFKSRMVKSKSDFRRSSAPTAYGRVNSPSSDIYNPLSNSTHDVRQLQRPLVDPSREGDEDVGSSSHDDLHDTYLSPTIPPYGSSVTRLFKSQSESGTPGPSPAPSPGPYHPPVTSPAPAPPHSSTSLRGIFQEDSQEQDG